MLELKTLLGLAPKFQIVVGATKRNAIFRVEKSSQSGYNGKFLLIMID